LQPRSALLAYIGVKMLLSHHFPIPTPVSLAIIAGILGVGVAASVLAAHRDTAALASPLADELHHLAEIGLRQGRRIVILVVGSTVLVVGLAMVVLPGPAFLVVPAGLVILGMEFIWARRWLCRVHRAVGKVRRTMGLPGDLYEPACGSGDRANGAEE
jgi:tellurite resistance protein TerC